MASTGLINNYNQKLSLPLFLALIEFFKYSGRLSVNFSVLIIESNIEFCISFKWMKDMAIKEGCFLVVSVIRLSSYVVLNHSHITLTRLFSWSLLYLVLSSLKLTEIFISFAKVFLASLVKHQV